ncbi:MAG: MBL fold metallo-hydrolase [Chloroflexota bacterium]
MILQLIRNATLLLDYAGSRLLIDPMLGGKHVFRSFAGISENPTVDLPLPAEDVLLNLDGVLVSHLHPDHFDEMAQQLIPKETPILAEPNTVSNLKGEMGFSKVQSVDQTLQWRGFEIEPTAGEHGYGEWAKRMGPVSGYILRAEGEPTIYWAGDTVLCPAVEQALAEHQPDIVITHSGGAQFGGPEGLILMDAEQTLKVAELAPQAKIIATHLESLDHCTVTRDGLRRAAEAAGVSERIIIPADGEMLKDLA